MDQKTIKLLFEEIRNIKKALSNVVTKDDTKKFLTKDDAKNFLTKHDAENFATKDDLNNLQQQLHAKIKYDIDNAVIQIGGIVDKRKAEKTVVVELDKRITQIERKLAT